MGFRQGAFAKVWSVQDMNGKFAKVRLSVSRKNKDTDQYEQTFAGFCTFVGSAYAGSSKLKEGSRIKLGEVDVTSKFDKAANKEYVNYTVFSFEDADGQIAASQSQPAAHNHVDSNPVEGDSAAMPY